MTKYVIGNWKSNLDISQSQELASTITGKDGLKVVICPPFTSLSINLIGGVSLGAQNCSQFDQGAYTGEVTADMLKDIGCEYVIVGHSERRAHFEESDDVILAKAQKIIENKMAPVICIGENLQEYEGGIADEVVSKQIEYYRDLSNEFIIAYEPIWAIGTGKVPTAEEIKGRIDVIKDVVNVAVLYGGSVNDSNAKELVNTPGVDGFLVGGASLKSEKFNAIISAF